MRGHRPLGVELEDLVEPLGLDAHAVVAHDHAQPLALDPHAQADPARRRGVLGGIAQQVHQHLGDAQRIDPQPHRRGRQVEHQVVAGGAQGGLDGLERRLDHLGEVDLGRAQLEAAGGQTGDIEQVVEQQLHGAGLAPQQGDGASLLVRQGRPGQQLGRRAHGRERVAQLVREQRQEAVLGRIGLLQRGARLLLRRQRAQQLVLAALQLGARLARLGLVAQDLHEADGAAPAVVHAHQGAIGPEARAVLALVLALVGRTALMHGGGGLARRHVGGAVLGGEDHVGRAADRLRLGMAQQVLGAAVPAGDDARGVHREDRIVARVLDHQPQALLAAPQGLLVAPRLGDVAQAGGATHHLALDIDDGRGGDRQVQRLPVAGLAERLEVVDAAPLVDARQHVVAPAGLPGPGQDRERLADDVLGDMAEDAPGAAIPAQDRALQREADDGVDRRRHHRRQPLADLVGALALGDVDEGEHHAGDAIVHRPVGQQARQQPGAIGQADLALHRRQALQHPRRVVGDLGVLESRRQVGQRPADIARHHPEQRHRHRRVARDAQVPVQEQGGDGGRVHQVLQVAVGVREFVDLGLELPVDGDEFLVDGLQFLAAATQCFHGGPQGLVAGLQFVVAGGEFAHRDRVPPHRLAQLRAQLRDLAVEFGGARMLGRRPQRDGVGLRRGRAEQYQVQQRRAAAQRHHAQQERGGVGQGHAGLDRPGTVGGPEQRGAQFDPQRRLHQSQQVVVGLAGGVLQVAPGAGRQVQDVVGGIDQDRGRPQLFEQVEVHVAPIPVGPADLVRHARHAPAPAPGPWPRRQRAGPWRPGRVRRPMRRWRRPGPRPGLRGWQRHVLRVAGPGRRRAAGEQPGRFGDGREAGRGGAWIRFGDAQEQPAARRQGEMEQSAQPGSRRWRQVAHEVAAAQEVEAGERQVAQQVVHREHHQLAQVAPDPERAALGDEMPLQRFGRDAGADRRRIETLAGDADRLRRDVGREDLHRRRCRQAARVVGQQHRDRIGLLAGGAGRDPHPHDIRRALVLEQGRQFVAQRGEGGGIAEEGAHRQPQLVAQRLGLARPGVERPEIVLEGRDAMDPHAPRDAAPQRGTAIAVERAARAAAQQVEQLPQQGIVGRRGRGGIGVACAIGLGGAGAPCGAEMPARGRAAREALPQARADPRRRQDPVDHARGDDGPGQGGLRGLRRVLDDHHAAVGAQATDVDRAGIGVVARQHHGGGARAALADQEVEEGVESRTQTGRRIVRPGLDGLRRRGQDGPRRQQVDVVGFDPCPARHPHQRQWRARPQSFEPGLVGHHERQHQVGHAVVRRQGRQQMFQRLHQAFLAHDADPGRHARRRIGHGAVGADAGAGAGSRRGGWHADRGRGKRKLPGGEDMLVAHLLPTRKPAAGNRAARCRAAPIGRRAGRG